MRNGWSFHNKARDGHLRSPDYFDVKQYPTIEFNSTSVKAVEEDYEVTGDLTFHGQKKPVTFELKGARRSR